MSQGLHVGACRKSCLHEMKAMERAETRRYRMVQKSCQGDPACLRIAQELYESNMTEMELDREACVDACR